MHIAGILKKMQGTLGSPIQYHWPIGEEQICVNDWIGQTLTFTFGGEIRCVACQKRTQKSYQQGHCFLCANRLAACDLCMVRPEQCHYHLGTCREPAWGETHCFIPHKVYLANTTGLKVGISRAHTLTQRWIDQGAVQAHPLLCVNTRRQSGLIEVILAQLIADKTNWRALLRGDAPLIDLPEEVARIRTEYQYMFDDFQQQWGKDALTWVDIAVPLALTYPIVQYPHTIRSLDLEKVQTYTGKLCGIKGQYLLFEDAAMNVRKHTGYQVSITID